jgi:hypothetical protein
MQQTLAAHLLVQAQPSVLPFQPAKHKSKTQAATRKMNHDQQIRGNSNN